jgi:uncharacterized membrane protein YqjE
MTENNEAGRGGSSGLFASFRNFAATAVAIARIRLELLANEVAEEKIRLGQLVVFGVVALLGLVIGTIFLAVFITALFWDSHRLIALGGFAALFLGMGAYAAIQFRTRAVAGSGLFSASLAELDKDRQQLSP